MQLMQLFTCIILDVMQIIYKSLNRVSLEIKVHQDLLA